jgi:hypothetical protein
MLLTELKQYCYVVVDCLLHWLLLQFRLGHNCLSAKMKRLGASDIYNDHWLTGVRIKHQPPAVACCSRGLLQAGLLLLAAGRAAAAAAAENMANRGPEALDSSLISFLMSACRCLLLLSHSRLLQRHVHGWCVS